VNVRYTDAFVKIIEGVYVYEHVYEDVYEDEDEDGNGAPQRAIFEQ